MSNNPNHIPLTIRESLKNTLTEFYYDIPSKSVNITVNHKYQLKTIGIPTEIISQDVNQGWYKFLDLVAKSLRENTSVHDEQDIQEIGYAIDDNNELIYRYTTKNDKSRKTTTTTTTTTAVVIDEQELKSKINNNFDGDFINYIIKQIKKTVKCEDVLIRQILYTCLSSYVGDDPINLGIIAPTSEGKTYPVEECMKFFPKDDVEKVGSMSAKVLVRKRGTLIDKNGEPIGQKIKELRKRHNLLGGKKENKEEKYEILEEIEKLYEGAKTLIDLRGKILVFLEPPKMEVWEILKPILSHDSSEIEYPFVNKTDREGHETKVIVVKGWPSCIFCSAKDGSSWSIWPEIKSRCLITSPNMIPEKYKQSTKLIAARYGKPNSIQQRIIISDNDIELAKKSILLLKHKIEQIRSKNNNGKISLWIPYVDLLEAELPSDKGTDVRFQKRVMAFLRTIPVLKHNLRKSVILENNETSIIADLKDLREVLCIVQNFDGIPRQKVEFFNDVLYPLYKSKTEPNKSEDGSKKEDVIAVTSKELCGFYKEKKNKIINTDNLRKTFLNELENNGIIDHELSKIHGKQYIYYPLVEPFDNPNNNNDSEFSSFSSNLGQFDQISQYSSTIYEKVRTKLTEEQLFYEIKELFPRRIEMTEFTTDSKEKELEVYLDMHTDGLKILDANDSSNIIITRQFIQEYLSEISKNRFDEKRSPNMPPFDKISQSPSNLGNFDKKYEEEKPEVKDFMTLNHLNKVEDTQEKERWKDE